jgi:ankyrin repeat protein
MLASEHGHEDTVKFLIQIGAKVDASKEFGQTSLMIASQNGNTAMVRLLIDYFTHDCIRV